MIFHTFSGIGSHRYTQLPLTFFHVRVWKTFSRKGQIVNILGLTSQIVCVVAPKQP